MTIDGALPEELDYFSPEFNDNFDEIIAEILEERPIVRASGMWIVTRHEDVRAVANDWETFTSSRGTIPWNESGAHFRPTAVDPPLHPHFRDPFAKLFAPRAIGPLEPFMRQEARALVAAIKEKRECDLDADLSATYISNVFFSGVLGLPREVAPKMLELINRWNLPPFDQEALAEYGRYVDEILRSQLEVPERSPMIEALLNLEVDGEPVAWEDKCNTLSLLIVGGLDTTINAINQSLLHLATHPDLRAELVDDPSLIPAAVEEFIRRYPGVVGLGRSATRDLELHGQKIKQGDRVMVGFGTAARDPRMFDDPLEIDVHRQAQGHLAFGSGIHRCLGSHFARLEVRVALEEFLAAIPHFTLDPESQPRITTGIGREVHGVRLLIGDELG
ncbi:cytochrome P450 [Nocardioides immobilis]|uniref:Cytochrome P450 n=1 Tax=Nocardioides immobilis TaxID=2049295 RepID=A0A417Y0W6_9ACTN|nr:cytochrome P450 [Nocardioides immobilis]RHW26245.1 cytochrome P450 [Nocardioides immobilis]